MTMMKYVILGNGIAGFTAAKTLRKQNLTCEITVISEEEYSSYNRPMMTKAPLKGFNFANFIMKPPHWYEEQNITELTNSKIIELNAKQQTVLLADGRLIAYDKCIYALGAKSATPPIAGVNQEWVRHFRTLADVADLRKRQLSAKTAVVIGGGIVGLEAAWQLKRSGIKVTILEFNQALMQPLLDEAASQVLEHGLVEAGIAVKTAAQVVKLSNAKQVLLQDGNSYSADLVILACGTRANLEIAKQAGLNTEDAVIVDEKMQTSIPSIYACGDCAKYQGINHGVWEQAIKQAEVAAINAAGGQATYQGIQKFALVNLANMSLLIAGELTDNATPCQAANRHEWSAYFTINQPKTTSASYEKYFFADNCLSGCVLINNLHQINVIKTAIHEKWSMKKFKDEVMNRC